MVETTNDKKNNANKKKTDDKAKKNMKNANNAIKANKSNKAIKAKDGKITKVANNQKVVKTDKKKNNEKQKTTEKGKVKKMLGKNVINKNKQKTEKKGNEKKMKKKRMVTSIRFKRPKTLKLPKNPKCPKIVKSCFKKKLDKYGIIKYPLTSEKAMKKIEEINTLAFICDKRANKKSIMKSVKELFGITCEKVNVLNRLSGDKKAYVRLSKEHDALEVANKIGIL
ncbi:60S ribosomal protein L23, putative (RPL23) [Plasmodium ovale wallikeri]|uniref:60S ribosomal protein L23, putative (RPL23) n=2 Tax=Plasmodium ovale TaxID=36330 RepID=A0A1A9AJN7_PLAOA|nr:60S ribosomal protein L23, putative (RPL23) [Plasmodium ovale wallikeri]SBT56427.1 60S ribosomal protein L23, putative (RPL23) [Plasmodium ovale wallikeri]